MNVRTWGLATIDWRRWSAVGLAVVGWADSIYLAVLKLTNQLAACGSLGDCESVNTSMYSEVAGVPIALLGAAAYALILGAIWIDRPGSSWAEMARYVFFGLTLVGVLYSAYLTYLEVFVLRAVCPYCVVSAVVMVALFALSIARLRAAGD